MTVTMAANPIRSAQGFCARVPVLQRPQATEPGTCRPGDVDCLKLQPAPKFKLLSPMPWLEHKAVEVAEPLKMDAKVLVCSVVAAPMVGFGIKGLSIGKEVVTIAKTTGLRTFVAQSGWKGTIKTLAMTVGKASLHSYAAKGAVVLGGAGVAAIVYQVKKHQAQGNAVHQAPARQTSD
jgi:hypothetical protein